MTQLFHSPPPLERSRTDVGVTAACLALVAVGALFSRKTGACGTGHYVLFQLLGGVIVSVGDELFGPGRFDAAAASAVAYLLNVGAFALILRAWYRRASAPRYVLGALAMTVVYLLSYFFLLPTADCP